MHVLLQPSLLLPLPLPSLTSTGIMGNVSYCSRGREAVVVLSVLRVVVAVA